MTATVSAPTATEIATLEALLRSTLRALGDEPNRASVRFEPDILGSAGAVIRRAQWIISVQLAADPRRVFGAAHEPTMAPEAIVAWAAQTCHETRTRPGSWGVNGPVCGHSWSPALTPWQRRQTGRVA